MTFRPENWLFYLEHRIREAMSQLQDMNSSLISYLHKVFGAGPEFWGAQGETKIGGPFKH